MSETTSDASLSGAEAPLQDSVVSMRVEVHLTAHPSVPAREVWAVEFDDPDLEGPAWTRDWLLREVDRLAWQGDERVSHDLEFRQDSFNWGTSSSGYSVILQVAEWVGSGVAGSTAYDAFKNLVRLMRSRMHTTGLPCNDSPLGRDEAIFRAQWAISKAYGLDLETLRLVSEDHDVEQETWVIALVDKAETEYEVTLGIVDGLPLTSRIVRRPHGPENLMG
ncbi:hypothetical protein [Sphaerimonospora mesophila]|uniref:hypothetical protein n=1 Tax=Sphaerimonospora mesophila TaxID=37483 RepID=UPI00128F7C4C